MIRIYKHARVPASLAKQASWTGEDVTGQLKTDQHCKCYLCERVLVVDFEVEHYKSRTNYPQLSFEWTNLLWSCSYCNRKKSSSFDNIVNPIEENVEDLIRQTLDFPNARAVFENLSDSSETLDSTVGLLSKVFNGSKMGLRSVREQQFYQYAMSRVTSFQEKTLRWLDTRSEEAAKAIMEELDISSEFLGFKYWIIKSNASLYKEFGEYMTWNKR